jgi:integrase
MSTYWFIQHVRDGFPVERAALGDRALLLVGFAAALRPSEIAGLAVDHLTRHADGIELLLPWRKNDQDAHGTKL